MYRVVSLGARTYSTQMKSLHQEDKKAKCHIQQKGRYCLPLSIKMTHLELNNFVDVGSRENI